MPFYPDDKTFCATMTELFRRAMASPSAVEAMTNSGLVVRLVTTGPAAILTIDGARNPPTFVCGATDRRPDLTLRLPVDVLHQIWLGQIRLRDAFFQGQVQVEGPMLRAFSLGELFRQVEALYPRVLHDRGLLPGI